MRLHPWDGDGEDGLTLWEFEFWVIFPWVRVVCKLEIRRMGDAVTCLSMTVRAGWYGAELRRELGLRNRLWARGRAHVESYGNPPVVVYAPDNARHGNFFDASYAAIAARAEWMRRFDKIHAQGRALPKAERRWRELDSSMSSDALLMNVFCAPGVADSALVRSALGVDENAAPVFGWKARVPLAPGPSGRVRFDRTEVDMRWGGLLVEAKLTESDFQTRAARIVEAYRDFDAVFERDLLPRVELRAARRRTAVEFAEEFTQEWEDAAPDDSLAREFQAAVVARARETEPAEPGYAGYQLIRNVLAAYAAGCSFCVVHDERRPDLREAWFEVMAAVKSSEMRVRCKVMTWQELAALVPEELQEFLDLKYGVVPVGMAASTIEDLAEGD
ncbi:MAG: PGN_0703 family putative restriction endonuclease [Terracidiphilus sp.]